MIKAAVIGLGVGIQHCYGYEMCEKSDLVAVCDLLDERLKAAKEKFPDVRTYKDYREMFKKEDLDVVSIATPNFTHAKIAKDALENGINVFLEKPFALTLEECDELIELSKKNGVKLTIDFELRINPFWSGAKELLESGDLGELQSTSIYYWRRPFRAFKPGGWPGKSILAGNMFLEEMVHWFDLAMYYGGDIDEVYCITNRGPRREFDYDQIAFVNFKYKNGAVGQISQINGGFHSRCTLWIVGSKGSVLGWANYNPTGTDSTLIIKEHPERLEDELKPELKMVRFGEESHESNSMRQHVCEFVRAILGERELVVKPEEARKSIEVALASEISARTGEAVKLPLKKSPDFAIERAREGIKYMWTYIEEG